MAASCTFLFWLFMALCSFIWNLDLTCHDLKILLLFVLKIENINQYTCWMNRFGKNWYLCDKVYSYLWWWCISLPFISFNITFKGTIIRLSSSLGIGINWEIQELYLGGQNITFTDDRDQDTGRGFKSSILVLGRSSQWILVSFQKIYTNNVIDIAIYRAL